jgi:hypothetical protein
MKNYLLIDFGASLLHTHHSRVIRGFTEMIEQAGDDLTVYLPMGSEIANVGKHSSHRRILIPSYHPVGFQFKQVSSWIPGLSRILYSKTENTKLHNIASRILSRTIVTFTVFTITKKLRDRSDSIVIFPTACPISMRLGKRIKRKFPLVKLVYRLTNTAERRGYFTRNFDIAFEASQLIRISSSDIRFGYEMEEYGSTLAISKSNLYFSPTPPCLEIREGSTDQTKKSFGFLGMAQRHKGIAWLVEIISRTLVNSKTATVSWIIQTDNPPPSELLEFSTNPLVKLLAGRQSELEISDAFTQISLICLPYNVDSYKLGASALAYRAADNLTAVATFRGSAFANEIERFGIGLVVDDLEGLIRGMAEFDTESSKTKIAEYNRIRHQSNLHLITW